MAELELGPHAAETFEVEVDRPRAEIVASGERDAGFAQACQQCAKNEDRRPHPPDQLEGRLRERLLGNVYRKGPVPIRARGTDVLKHFAHDLDVE